ncbi:hypothetical protein DD605_08070 [Enterobacter cloacae complex sp. 3DZ3S2B]|nr:hypothetical protein DD603_02795 [Enterobacter cloacae complex sp. 2DZ2F2B]RYA45055.1 hypothetical protein DD605_08070 [Enterobacter cloacae complex sp. 3DZ3S2B]
MIVTSCYIANTNFTCLERFQQVKTLKGRVGILSEKGLSAPIIRAQQDNQAVFLQYRQSDRLVLIAGDIHHSNAHP